MDRDGPMASDAADGTSLIDIPGMKAANSAKSRSLALVTNYEYKELPPNDGVSTGSHWSKLPAVMSLAKLDQDKKTGKLQVVDYDYIDFSKVHGGWIHCGSTLSAWNTHRQLGRVRAGRQDPRRSSQSSRLRRQHRHQQLQQVLFGDPAAANPYHYGLVPEVTVKRDGTATVVKHYAPGRYAREMIEIASDHRTSIGGDDGKNTGLFMFVADKPKDLSAGTLYAAKVTQTSAENGGTYTLQWIRLGHATNEEIKALVDGGIKFSDIFDVCR